MPVYLVVIEDAAGVRAMILPQQNHSLTLDTSGKVIAVERGHGVWRNPMAVKCYDRAATAIVEWQRQCELNAPPTKGGAA